MNPWADLFAESVDSRSNARIWVRIHQPFSRTVFVSFLQDLVNLNVTKRTV